MLDIDGRNLIIWGKLINFKNTFVKWNYILGLDVRVACCSCKTWCKNYSDSKTFQFRINIDNYCFVETIIGNG